jgi:hypothetical protein
MPPHPFDASLCHVINAGLKNIKRLNAECKPQAVEIEVEHLLEVENILNWFCLYDADSQYSKMVDDAFQKYWKENRLIYKAKIEADSLHEMMNAWGFLAPDYQTFRQEEGDPYWDDWRTRNPHI